MKSRQLALVNRSKNPVTNGGGFNLLVVRNSENLGFASPFSGVRLADNSNSPPDNNNDLYGGFNARFSPSMAIVLVGLVGACFFMACFSICFRKCASEDESLRGANAQARRQNEGNRGLDRAVIESFPVFSYDLVKGLKAQTKETLECAVCLSEFEDDEQLRLLPKCSHAFHPDCIDTWLFSHTTCPVCRTSLVPADDGNPTGTGYGIIEPPEITPSYEVAVVVDGARNGSVRRDNIVETPMAPESADSQESLYVLGLDEGKKFRRSYSTGHSLVRLRKDMDQLATEWYICTAEGLKPGLQRNCSLTALSHSRSQGPSTSQIRPGFSKQASMSGTASCSRDTGGSGRRWYERGLRSERLTISSMYPSSFLRSYSEQRTPADSRNQESSAGSQQERRVYLQSLKHTLKRLTGRDREWADNSQSGWGSSRRAVDNSQSGRGSSRRAVDNSQSGRGSCRSVAEESLGPITA